MCQLKSNKSTEHLNLTSTEIGKIFRLENAILLHLQFRVGGRNAIFFFLNIQKTLGSQQIIRVGRVTATPSFFFLGLMHLCPFCNRRTINFCMMMMMKLNKLDSVTGPH